MNSIITTHDLTKRYGDRTAVDRLSLAVGPGEIYCFLGLNGAGKTTTIRMLLGMIRPTAGSARLFGMRAHSGAGDLWSRVGYLVEVPRAYPELTVRENLEVVRRLRRVTDMSAVDRTMERFRLTPEADRRAVALSLGNLQRLGLAKAMLHGPELLILDEPANGLDPAGVVEVRELLRDLAHARGVTIFMSSHILSEVARVATRIGVIHQGRLIEELGAGDLAQRRRPRLVVDARDRLAARSALAAAGFAVAVDGEGRFVMVEERATARPEAVAQLLADAATPPTHLCVEQEDFETYFLRLVGMRQGAGS
jgi:ABC-2 type transport system ATP-binding protein